MRFIDRKDAANKLVLHLREYSAQNTVLLAIPRGGVPIAFHIAKALHLPIELLLAKKIGHPDNPEYAIGAVSLGNYIVNDRAAVSQAYIDKQVTGIRGKLRERQRTFADGRDPFPLEGKTVIVVDDGAATGFTLISAIPLLRRQKPARIIAAIPVAPPETAGKIEAHVDRLICLHTPRDFVGVGAFYEDFSQVDDDTVHDLLREARSFAWG